MGYNRNPLLQNLTNNVQQMQTSANCTHTRIGKHTCTGCTKVRNIYSNMYINMPTQIQQCTISLQTRIRKYYKPMYIDHSHVYNTCARNVQTAEIIVSMLCVGFSEGQGVRQRLLRHHVVGPLQGPALCHEGDVRRQPTGDRGLQPSLAFSSIV